MGRYEGAAAADVGHAAPAETVVAGVRMDDVWCSSPIHQSPAPGTQGLGMLQASRTRATGGSTHIRYRQLKCGLEACLSWVPLCSVVGRGVRSEHVHLLAGALAH